MYKSIDYSQQNQSRMRGEKENAGNPVAAGAPGKMWVPMKKMSQNYNPKQVAPSGPASARGSKFDTRHFSRGSCRQLSGQQANSTTRIGTGALNRSIESRGANCGESKKLFAQTINL